MSKQHKGKLFEKAVAIAKSQIIEVHNHKYCPTVYYSNHDAKYVLAMEMEGQDCFQICCVNAQSTVPMGWGKKRYSLMDADSDLKRLYFRADDGEAFEKAADGWDLYDQVLAEQGKPPQNSRQETTVSYTDLQPVEESNFARCEISHVCEVSLTKAVSLAEFSKKFAQVSVICAAAAGAEFANLKGQCQHGEWMKVLKLLPFGKDSVYRYMKIAEELQARLSEGDDSFDLLQLPNPQELLDGNHSALVDKINKVTGEQSLRQLYFDWGICKAPGGPTGGKRDITPKTPKQLAEVRRQDANESVGELCFDLQKVCIGNQRCIQHADIDHLKLLEGDLIDALKNVKELIKAG